MTALVITGCVLGWLMCGLLPAKAAYRLAELQVKDWSHNGMKTAEPASAGFKAFFPFILGPVALIFWLAWLFWRAPTIGERRLERARRAEAQLAEARQALRDAGLSDETIEPEAKQPERHSWKLKFRAHEYGMEYFMTDGVDESYIGRLPFGSSQDQHLALTRDAWREIRAIQLTGVNRFTDKRTPDD